MILQSRSSLLGNPTFSMFSGIGGCHSLLYATVVLTNTSSTITSHTQTEIKSRNGFNILNFNFYWNRGNSSPYAQTGFKLLYFLLHLAKFYFVWYPSGIASVNESQHLEPGRGMKCLGPPRKKPPTEGGKDCWWSARNWNLIFPGNESRSRGSWWIAALKLCEESFSVP